MLKPAIEKKFEYKGFPCVIMMQSGAFRTGYVGLPKGNKLYGKNYLDICIDCHGGVTYSNEKLFGQNDENVWWIGFDCYHYGDGRDYDSAFEIFKDSPEHIKSLNNTMNFDASFGEPIFPSRSLSYCETQCMWIVNQLLEGEDK